MNKVDKHKVLGVKQELLKNKSYKEAMLNNNYSEGKANRGIAEPVIQEALGQIKADYDKEGLTAERTARTQLELEREAGENYKKATNKQDRLLWFRERKDVSATNARYTLTAKQDTTVKFDYTDAEKQEYNRLAKSICSGLTN